MGARNRRGRPDEGPAAPSAGAPIRTQASSQHWPALHPQAILPGGIVLPLFPPSWPYLNAEKIQVPEVYN